MSTDSTAREVFEEVDPDPDAVLEAYGAQSPEELVASAGEHEPTIDEELDADDAAAEALFGELSAESLEASESKSESELEPEPEAEPDVGTESPQPQSSSTTLPSIDWTGDTAAAIDAEVVVIEPSVTVQEGDGRAVDRDGTVLERVLADENETVATRVSGGSASSSDSNSGLKSNSNSDLHSIDRPSTDRTPDDEFTLVGPEPDAVRIGNDSFGTEAVDVV